MPIFSFKAPKIFRRATKGKPDAPTDPTLFTAADPKATDVVVPEPAPIVVDTLVGDKVNEVVVNDLEKESDAPANALAPQSNIPEVKVNSDLFESQRVLLS